MSHAHKWLTVFFFCTHKINIRTLYAAWESERQPQSHSELNSMGWISKKWTLTTSIRWSPQMNCSRWAPNLHFSTAPNFPCVCFAIFSSVVTFLSGTAKFDLTLATHTRRMIFKQPFKPITVADYACNEIMISGNDQKIFYQRLWKILWRNIRKQTVYR